MTDSPFSLYEHGRLVVAAVRRFTEREDRMPTAEEIAEMIEMPAEVVRPLCRLLLDEGVLGVDEDGSGDRLRVEDYLRLEELYPEADEDELGHAIARYRTRKEDKQKKIEQMFRKKESDRKGPKGRPRIVKKRRPRVREGDWDPSAAPEGR